jgi:hypothetical protein
MILRLENVRWALCVGQNSGIMYLSLRTRERKGHAGRTIARIVGREGKAGGHGMMAGGIVHIEKCDPATYRGALATITGRFLEMVDAAEEEPLLLLAPIPPKVESDERSKSVPPSPVSS